MPHASLLLILVGFAALLSVIEGIGAVPSPLHVLQSTMAKMAAQPASSAFWEYNYGPGYALAAMYEASVPGLGMNWSTVIGSHLDALLSKQGSYPFNISHNIRMPYTGAVGEPTAGALAFLARAMTGEGSASVDMQIALTTAEVYVMEFPTRLPDGTFARPAGWQGAPGNLFLWGDDQFMSLALLCRLARAGASNASAYLTTSIQNALRNAHYVQQASGLFPHGWDFVNNVSSCCLWGRANGWVAMSLVEVLLAMNAKAPERAQILAILTRLLDGAVAVQYAADGRWHQVLDVPTTFLETSATAMVLFAMATGVNEGWLDRGKYGAAIELAWSGLTKAVNSDGTVSGICAGTPVEPDVASYNARPTGYNTSQPGLGAVFRAALAYHAFLQ